MNRSSFIIATLILTWVQIALPAVKSSDTFVPPVERCQFAGPTPYDTLQGFLQGLSGSRGFTVEQIATTVQGRSVIAVRVTSSSGFAVNPGKIRVLLFAQQHGDEPSGKEALTMLLAKLASGREGSLLKHLDLIVVPLMNPDGAELHQRRTADSVDLNRNHLLLSSPETKGLHDLFYRWMPQVTLDLHEYGSFSSSWSDSGFIKRGDVQLGMLTNLNTSAVIYRFQHARIAPFIAEAIERNGYSFNEYIVGSPGDRIRHSTTEINDGRQSFGILGSISFIQEGRKWRSLGDQLERRARSQLASLEALLAFCSAHGREISKIVAHERRRLSHLVGSTVVIRMEHFPGKATLSIPVHTVVRDVDTMWTIKPYHSEVRALRSVTLPKAYGIPKENSQIIDLLLRHHVLLETFKTNTAVDGVAYEIDSVWSEVVEEDTLPKLTVHPEETLLEFHAGDFIVPTTQLHSLFLATALEPESVWGLVKYDRFADILKRERYPIARIR